MNLPRWKLSELFVLIFACGIALAAYKYYWMPPPDPNTRPYLAVYLAVLAVTTLGSFFAKPAFRRACQGFAVFGWCNLLFVMWGGFWLATIYDAERVVHGAQLGLLLGILCAFAAARLFEPPKT